MEDIVFKTRRRNLQRLNKERFGGLKRRLAIAAQKHESQINRWLSEDKDQRKAIQARAAREIEDRLGLPPGWMDEDHNSVTRNGPVHVELPQIIAPRYGARHLPIIGTLLTGLVLNVDAAAQFVEWATGDDEAYIVHVDTESYFPRLRKLECLCIEPSRPINAGNHVAVKRKDNAAIYYLELRVEGRDSFTFSEVCDPEKAHTVAREDVEWCHFVAAILDPQLARKIPRGKFYL